MASLGHIAVGMAASRLHGGARSDRRAWLKAALLWSLLSMLPDADVIGFGFGVRYEDEWGHRGATHSFVFSLALGAAIGLAAPLIGRPRLRTGVLASLVLASHAVLDTLTNGGLGCALLWPFDLTRYFAPWNPIPVSPIGLRFFSPYGLSVAAVELLLFAPLFWYGLQRPAVAGARVTPRRRWLRAAVAAVFLATVWLLTSEDPVRERVVRVALGDDTEFAAGFTEQALDSVRDGDTEQDVLARLGPPFYEFITYPDRPDVCVVVRFEKGRADFILPTDACERRGVTLGVDRTTVLKALGPPAETCWAYSRDPDGSFYRARGVCFSDGRVTAVVRRWMR